MQYARDAIAQLVGAHVRVRRYVQPSLRPGDPRRELEYGHEGTVTAIDAAGRLVLEGAEDAIWPEATYLGGDPKDGGSLWFVTEIYRDGEEEEEARPAATDWVHVGGDGSGKARAYVGRNTATGEVRVSVTSHVLVWDAETAARVGELLQRAAMPSQVPPATEART